VTTSFFKRLVLFLTYWWGIVPGFLYLVRDYFRLANYARFAYPTVITPMLFLLIVWAYQKELKKIKFPKSNKQTMVFALLSLGSLWFYLSLYPIAAYLIIQKNITAEWVYLTLVYGSLTLVYAFAFMALFSWKIIKKFKQQIGVYFGLNALYYGLFFLLFRHWGLFSKLTGILTFPLLKQIYPTTKLIIEGNNIGLFIDTFRVGLGEACSGTMLILLFIVLYGAICCVRPAKINRKRGVALLLLGSMGAFLLNVIRVFLLMVIGTKNPEFAMGLFHTNATWILFVGYFLFYLSLTYPLLTRRSNLPVAKHN